MHTDENRLNDWVCFPKRVKAARFIPSKSCVNYGIFLVHRNEVDNDIREHMNGWIAYYLHHWWISSSRLRTRLNVFVWLIIRYRAGFCQFRCCLCCCCLWQMHMTVSCQYRSTCKVFCIHSCATHVTHAPSPFGVPIAHLIWCMSCEHTKWFMGFAIGFSWAFHCLFKNMVMEWFEETVHKYLSQPPNIILLYREFIAPQKALAWSIYAYTEHTLSYCWRQPWWRWQICL